jgi:hypothetical protein
VVIAGGVTPAAAMIFNAEFVDCNASVSFKVLERDQPDDAAAGLTLAEVSSRTRIRVLHADGTMVDEETGFAVVQPDAGILRFESGSIALTPDSTPVPGNGLVEVQHGQTLEAVYDDETLGVADPAIRKQGTSRVTCSAFAPGEVRDLLVEGFDPATGNLSISYTPSCSSWENTIVFGPLDDVGSYGYTGQACEIGNTGGYDAFNPGSGSYFFVVVPNDGSTTEGSYGKDSAGAERPEDPDDPSCALIRDLGSSCE